MKFFAIKYSSETGWKKYVKLNSRKIGNAKKFVIFCTQVFNLPNLKIENYMIDYSILCYIFFFAHNFTLPFELYHQ